MKKSFKNNGAGEGNRTLVVSLEGLRRPPKSAENLGFQSVNSENDTRTSGLFAHFYRTFTALDFAPPHALREAV